MISSRKHFGKVRYGMGPGGYELLDKWLESGVPESVLDAAKRVADATEWRPAKMQSPDVNCAAVVASGDYVWLAIFQDETNDTYGRSGIKMHAYLHHRSAANILVEDIPASLPHLTDEELSIAKQRYEAFSREIPSTPTILWGDELLHLKVQPHLGINPPSSVLKEPTSQGTITNMSRWTQFKPIGLIAVGCLVGGLSVAYIPTINPLQKQITELREAKESLMSENNDINTANKDLQYKLDQSGKKQMVQIQDDMRVHHKEILDKLNIVIKNQAPSVLSPI